MRMILFLFQRQSYTHYFYEATVGAGLPFITTLRGLLETGDKILQIEGIFRQDVQAIILARESGLKLELSHIPVESLVPEPLRACAPAQEFMQQLPKFDPEFGKKQQEADNSGEDSAVGVSFSYSRELRTLSNASSQSFHAPLQSSACEHGYILESHTLEGNRCVLTVVWNYFCFEQFSEWNVCFVDLSAAFIFDGRNVVEAKKLREIGFIVYSIGKPLDSWLKDMPVVA
ncbi:hypothetical protein RIF29_41925 [Crotalaria pallida]|uniref:Uncharacterized protein n=1 Tax=Crotalaria pallida TaxID=3830 RepID=A0AAN9HRZ0_CROPI